LLQLQSAYSSVQAWQLAVWLPMPAHGLNVLMIKDCGRLRYDTKATLRLDFGRFMCVKYQSSYVFSILIALAWVLFHSVEQYDVS
jgi:hypothetical protein